MANTPTKPGTLGDWAIIHYFPTTKASCDFCIHHLEGSCLKLKTAVKELGPDFCKQCRYFSTKQQPYPICSHSIYVPQVKAHLCHNRDCALYSQKCLKCNLYTTKTTRQQKKLPVRPSSLPSPESAPFQFLMSDIHAHAVFGVDDGSANLEMSLELLHAAYKEGIRDLVCTFHSWGMRENYAKHFTMLQTEAKKANIGIHLYQGCEIQCSVEKLDKIILRLNNNLLPTINHTPYALIEFDPYESVDCILHCATQLKDKTKNKFVIAHVEKCRNLEDALDKIKKMGFLFQLNAYSLVEEPDPKIRCFARRLVDEKRISFLGSDCHRTDHRSPNVQSGIRYIYEHCDKEYARNICTENARKLLFGKKSK